MGRERGAGPAMSFGPSGGKRKRERVERLGWAKKERVKGKDFAFLIRVKQVQFKLKLKEFKFKLKHRQINDALQHECNTIRAILFNLENNQHIFSFTITSL